MDYRMFWEAGFRVFGLYGRGPDGKCECGNPQCPEKSLFKHPRVSNWQHTPHWSEEQLETMELMRQFRTGYGVLLRGFLVIDIDARNGGLPSFVKLQEDIPEIAGAGMIVETGSGGGSKHLYFKVPEGTSLMVKLTDYPGIDFKSGAAFVVGPGSLHASGRSYVTVFGSPDEVDDAPEALLTKLRMPEKHRAEIGGRTVDVSHQDLADMVACADGYDDYETWVKIGMSLHHASGGSAFEVWDEWSRRSAKYDEAEMIKKWHSFGKGANPVTLGTLAYYAEQGGWQAPVTFTTDKEFDFDELELPAKEIDTRGIDLLRPPGLIGLIAEWIESRARRKRERLSTMAAIYAFGNAVGLRYIDDMDRVTTNLFVFNVAGSGSGKEAVQDAVKEIHKACGIAAATHGAIKSEQELVRNLIRHQPSYYVLDEVGFFLQKIKNAQSKGGAPYLDGVIGMLMSAYSKADGFLLLTGDAKEDVRMVLRKEAAQIDKQIEDNGPKDFLTRRLESITHQLSTLDDGLERPFVSMSGFTTNVNFDTLVDYEAAANGFIGRSILCIENDTAPPRKRNWSKTPLPEGLKIILQQLSQGGSFDATAGDGRVEFYGDRIAVPTEPEAKELLGRVADLFDKMAEDHKSMSGLEALPMRGYEQVAKVSLILAIPEGIRTVEHVRWAYALIKRDIETKMRLVTANDREKDAPAIALRAKIANLIAGDDGEKLGVIVNRLRKYKREDIDKVLADMVDRKIASYEDSVNKYTKKSFRVYKLVDSR